VLGKTLPAVLIGLAEASVIVAFALRGTFLKDLPLGLMLHQLWPMALIGAVSMAAAAVFFRRLPFP